MISQRKDGRVASPGDLFDVNCATRRVVDAVSFGADHFVCPWRGDQDWNRIPKKPYSRGDGQHRLPVLNCWISIAPKCGAEKCSWILERFHAPGSMIALIDREVDFY